MIEYDESGSLFPRIPRRVSVERALGVTLDGDNTEQNPPKADPEQTMIAPPSFVPKEFEWVIEDEAAGYAPHLDAKPMPEKPKRSVKDIATSLLAEFLLMFAALTGGYTMWELYWTSYIAEGNISAALDDFANRNPTPARRDVEPTHHKDLPPEISDPTYGEVFGALHIPQWNYMRIPIASGVGDDVLDNGYAGWYEFTQKPGQLGNFGLAAHRRTYGNSFRRVDVLNPGDPIVVETADKFMVYTVKEKKIVYPEQGEVLYPVPDDPSGVPETSILTMTTCHPEYGNSERYIVHSQFEYWTNKAEGKPGVIKDEEKINPTGRVDY